MNSRNQQLIADLEGRDLATQRRAAEDLAQLGHDAQDAILALARHVGDADEIVAQWCSSALEDVGPPLPRQIGDLTALAKAAQPDIAYWSVTLLGRAGEPAVSAIPTLVERLTDAATPQVQQRAAWALGNMGPAASAAVAALESIAKSVGPVAKQAARSLQRIRAA